MDIYPCNACVEFRRTSCGCHSQPVAGFADLVAKVKPAVISVGVKLDEPQSAVENEEDQGDSGNGNIPEPGPPMERFFQQYGFDQQHNFHHHHQITGEGSGFFTRPRATR